MKLWARVWCLVFSDSQCSRPMQANKRAVQAKSHIDNITHSIGCINQRTNQLLLLNTEYGVKVKRLTGQVISPTFFWQVINGAIRLSVCLMSSCLFLDRVCEMRGLISISLPSPPCSLGLTQPELRDLEEL